MDNNIIFKKQSFYTRFVSMFKVDLKRTFITPLYYIMVAIAFVVPILVLVMTTKMPTTTIDPVTNVETPVETFTNVWQSISSVSGSSSAMSIISMCNINLVYLFTLVPICLFVSEEFKSGYAKSIFVVRAKKSDYVISKSIIGFICGGSMIIAYFIGSLIGGKIAGLSFALEGVKVYQVFMCMLSKVCLVAVFVPIYLVISIASKQRAWLSILCSLAASMLLFTMIPMITPLNASIINVILCLVGGTLFSVGLGVVSNIILNKTSLV